MRRASSSPFSLAESWSSSPWTTSAGTTKPGQPLAGVVGQRRVHLSDEPLRALLRLGGGEAQGGADVRLAAPELLGEEPGVRLQLPRLAQPRIGDHHRIEGAPRLEQGAAARGLRRKGGEQRQRTHALGAKKGKLLRHRAAEREAHHVRALHAGGVEDGERVVRHLPRAVRSRWGVALSHAAAVGREAAVRLSEVGKLHRPGGRRRVQALQPEDGIALALIDDVETAAVFRGDPHGTGV